ncbi:beta-glucosidase BglX [Stigmatella aurantiaca]|uniref:beta-glucosidase n=1 Tax=Stigmatella aurantiaca (strain DW4/3-1) TaxID=378806 RepID=Q08TA9_STIAD|nr:beta-glucosidase BglX [Stigmatella aurantiaca]ADO75922.1 Periplasmic beta-glucosidase [Stigmatella aurantiaca DW4/3-1]EAU63726.1 periplasmic beta-glucosidase [Stigmatella aurantiaca DW4/3-1]
MKGADQGNHPRRKASKPTKPGVGLPLVLVLGACAGKPVPPPPPEPVLPEVSAPGGAPAPLAGAALDERVEGLLRRMTLEEKAGQLAQYSQGVPTGPGTGRGDHEDMARTGAVGAFLNVVGARETNRLQRIAVEQSRLRIPLLFGFDVIHGHRTLFPVPLGMASSFDPALVEQAMRVAAEEAAADGVRWVFSPMVDIARDARWGRIVEGSGEDPYLGAAMARAYVRGYQGASLAEPTSVAASVKHFAAYGAAEAGRDYHAVDMSDVNLRQVYLRPYQAAVEAGAATVMTSFNTLNGVPATANPYLLTEILRKEWGFQGFVVSDWNAIQELVNHGTALDGAAAARQALTAGVEMDMEGNLYAPELPALVRAGKLSEAQVDEAVRRVLRVKFALGLFEKPYAEQTAVPATVSPEKRALARRVAEASMVLLKNEGPVLPLGPSVRKVALVGPLADSGVDMMGPWAGRGEAREHVTLRAALERRLKGGLVYAKGTDFLSRSTQGFEEAVRAAASADVVIAALGEEAWSMTGEAASRTSLGLPGNQEQLLAALAATGKPVVLVLFNGHPLTLQGAQAQARAIVEAWYPGIEAGPALANLLWGEVNFSARLPVSLPRSVGQVPLYYNALGTGRPAGAADLTRPPTGTSDKYISRYIDEQNTPLYPFGYGLSYTTFGFSPPTLSAKGLKALEVSRQGQAALQVKTQVRNTGPVAGTVVAQLYVRVRGASTAQPVRQLAGFERVRLAPGEAREVVFPLGFQELSFLNARSERVVEPGTLYEVWVGDSSDATAHVEFTME